MQRWLAAPILALASILQLDLLRINSFGCSAASYAQSSSLRLVAVAPVRDAEFWYANFARAYWGKGKGKGKSDKKEDPPGWVLGGGAKRTFKIDSNFGHVAILS